MASKRLPHYLKAYRKRSGLSQDEVALLLGVLSGAKLCRYERFSREPTLPAALALEVIFRRPVADLFAGLYLQIQEEIKERARKLIEALPEEPRNAATMRKWETLSAIINEEIEDF